MNIRIWITASLLALTAAAGAQSKRQTRLTGDSPAQTRQIWKKGFAGDLSLKSATVPEGTDTIRANTFEGCKNLRTVRLPGTIEYIDDRAFKGCSSLDSIIFPSDEAIRKAHNGGLDCHWHISSIAFEDCDGPLSSFVNVREPYSVSWGCLYYAYPEAYYIERIAPLTFRSCLTPKYLFYSFMYFYSEHKWWVLIPGILLTGFVILLLISGGMGKEEAEKYLREEEERQERERQAAERLYRDTLSSLASRVDADPAECELQLLPGFPAKREFAFVAWDKRKVIVNDSVNSFEDLSYIHSDNDYTTTEREVGGGTDPFLAALYMFIGAATHGPAGSTAGYAAAKWSGEANKKIETTTKNDYIVDVYTYNLPVGGIRYHFGEDKASADKLSDLLWRAYMKLGTSLIRN